MTDAELAILSIIAEAAISGYDLQTVIDQRNLRAWTQIGVESVYYVVEKLEKQGLIEIVRKDHAVDSVRQQYRITSAGVGILQTAVTDMLSTPRHSTHSFEIGLSNLHVLRTSQVRHALHSYRNSLQHRHDSMRSKLKTLLEKTTPPFHIISMFEHQLTMLRAEIDWLDDWIGRWEAQAPPDSAEDENHFQEHDVPRMQQLILPNDPDSFHKRPTRAHIVTPIESMPPVSDDPAKTQVSHSTDVIQQDDEDV